MLSLSRAFFQSLAGSTSLKRLASRYGMRAGGFARRFIAGETLGDALDAAATLSRDGLDCTFNYLGESVTAPAAANEAADTYIAVLREVSEAGLPCQASVKLTQLGLAIDPDRCETNLRRVLDAGRDRWYMRIDMEQARWVTPTLDLFERVWRDGYRNVGVVLQSCLYRTEQDLGRINTLGGGVRLCKGAYQEDRAVAYPRKVDVDAAFVRLMRALIDDGADPAFATHDPQMIEATRAHASQQGRRTETFEFQMLFGVRRDLQRQLRDQGYRVRIYLPFGHQWFPYFMRRLGERPANVQFVLRSLFYERRR